MPSDSRQIARTSNAVFTFSVNFVFFGIFIIFDIGFAPFPRIKKRGVQYPTESPCMDARESASVQFIRRTPDPARNTTPVRGRARRFVALLKVPAFAGLAIPMQGDKKVVVCYLIVAVNLTATGDSRQGNGRQSPHCLQAVGVKIPSATSCQPYKSMLLGQKHGTLARWHPKGV